MFKRGQRLLQRGHRKAKINRDKHARYAFKGEHGFEEQAPLHSSSLNAAYHPLTPTPQPHSCVSDVK